MTVGMSQTALLLALDWHHPELLTAGLSLAGALLVGAVLLALFNRWHRRSEPDSLSPGAQLAEYRRLYEEGVISQEEFDRLRALLGGQLRQALEVPPALPASKT